MATPTIQQLKTLGDFAVNYMWDMQLIKGPSMGILPAMILTSQELNVRCTGVTGVPSKTTAPIAATVRGHTVYQPGFNEFGGAGGGGGGSITFSFLETIDNKMAIFLKAWQESCCDPMTLIGWPKMAIEGVIRLVRLTRQQIDHWEWVLYGCWPTSYSLGNLAGKGAAGGIVSVDVVMQYDYYRDGLPGTCALSIPEMVL